MLDLIQEAATNVEQNEKDTHRYEINASMRPAKDGTEIICMVERYFSALRHPEDHFADFSSLQLQGQAGVETTW